MKKECELVKDLLIGYADNTLHSYSKEIVTEHLKTCEKCKNLLVEIKQDIVYEDNQSEVDYLKKVNKKFHNKKKIIIGLVIALAIFIIFNIILFYAYSKTSDKMQIFFKDTISKEEITNLSTKLTNQFDLSLTYISKEESLEKMKNKLEENSHLLDDYEGKNNIFPESFIIEVNTKDTNKLINYLEDLESVDLIHMEETKNPYIILRNKIICFFEDI